MELINDPENPLLEILTSQGYRLIPIYSIIYIKADGKGSSIILQDSEKIITRNLLNSYETLLPAEVFYRCHNSYIINLSYIKTYNRYTVRFTNESIIPISRNNSRAVREKVIRFMQFRRTNYTRNST